MLATKTVTIDSLKFNLLADTNPTTRMVINEEYCTTAVTNGPINAPLNRLPVSFASNAEQLTDYAFVELEAIRHNQSNSNYERDAINVAFVELLSKPCCFVKPSVGRMPGDTFYPCDSGTAHTFDTQMGSPLECTRRAP